MNQWSFQQRNPLVHSRDPYEIPYKAVVHTKRCVQSDTLMHYGVPGQKWGVITKEYQPVAVDHRKLRTKSVVRTSTTPRSAGSMLSREGVQSRAMQKREREGYWTKENGRTVWRQNGKSFSPSERRQKIVQRALIGAGIVAGLLITYGAVKYSRVQKAKAYSGILNRFLKQNPGANLNTPDGRKLYQRGLDFAKENSKGDKVIKKTNRYLRQHGLNLNSRQALDMYGQRKGVEKALRPPSANHNRSGALDLIRRYRLRIPKTRRT